MKLSLVFFFLVSLQVTFCGKKHALLVATTKEWLSYRHQSTLLHAYQTLLANGFRKNHIITMFYDDIAFHAKNPESGIVRNHPEGPNLYDNVKKDYTGKDVNANTFVAVLSGNSSAVNGGPVIKSRSKDSLFIYIVGMGSYQYIVFPDGSAINAKEFVNLLEHLRNTNKIKQILVSVETSFSSTLFEGRLSTDNKIFAMTATFSDEYPYTAYCYSETKLCYGSLYGVVWTSYSDRLRQLKSGENKTLFDHYNHVRNEVPYTHVSIFGDLQMGKTKLKDFLAYKLERNDKLKVGISMIGLEENLQIGNYASERELYTNKFYEDNTKTVYYNENINKYL